MNLYQVLGLYFIVSAGVSCELTRIVRFIARKYKVVDKPTGGRKIHMRPTPLLGGVAIIVTFFLVVFASHLIGAPGALENNVLDRIPIERIFGVIIGSAIILFIGVWDDIRVLPARVQFFGVTAAILVTTFFGMGLRYLSNPYGGVIDLYQFAYLADALVFVWLITLTHTTKLLDGLDGLVTGIVGIGALLISVFSIFSEYYQPDIALISIILAGACAGFLVWNKHPATIFLGNAGSLWLGYILGVLAVISGGKLAIALLVLGVPLIDMVIVVFRRVFQGKAPWKGDATHLHFQLLKSGLGHKKTVYLYWFLAFGFGSLTVFLQSSGKLFALLLLLLFTSIVIGLISRRQNNMKK